MDLTESARNDARDTPDTEVYLCGRQGHTELLGQYIPGFRTTSSFSYLRVYFTAPSFKGHVTPSTYGSAAIGLPVNLADMLASLGAESNLEHWDQQVLRDTRVLCGLKDPALTPSEV